MKRIAGLSAAPDGLRRYLADPLTIKTWKDFGSFEAGVAKRELTEVLVARQHGLCAYCEIALIPNDTGIEHFVAQSDPMDGATRSLDYRNLMAVCRGGSNTLFGKPGCDDPKRYLPSPEKGRCCDHAKGDRPSADFIDPRDTSAQPSLFTVDLEGGIGANEDSCKEHIVSVDKVKAHIGRLGLDIRLRRNARREVWEELFNAYEVYKDRAPTELDALLVDLARSQLLPNEAGNLAPFFTTARSFFGPLAERILAEAPQSWV